MFDVQLADLVTIGLLVILEGVLSADNALVLAILVLSVPRAEQQRALRYGMIGAFGFRILAVLLAAYLMRVGWVKLAGGLYLAYLVVRHFSDRAQGGHGAVPPAKSMFGLSPFWSTVVRVELVDLAFSVDSILVAVALSPKLWVVVTGGILGIVMMRLVAGQMIALIRKYPALVDGAFVIIGWVAIKLVLEYAAHVGWVDWHIPKWLSLGLIVVIFIASYLYARKHEHRPATPSDDLSGDRPPDEHPQSEEPLRSAEPPRSGEHVPSGEHLRSAEHPRPGEVPRTGEHSRSEEHPHPGVDSVGP